MKRGSYKGYTTTDKEAIVIETFHSSVHEIAKKYKVPYSTLQGWRKKYLNNQDIPPGRTRTKGAGTKPHLTQQQEEEIIAWILECRQCGVPLTKEMIKEYTKDSFPNPNFHVSDGWLNSFMKRHNLVVRVQSDRIINMDEVPVTFDMTPSRIIDFKGTKHPIIVTTGSTKKRCTVVLSCFADGTLLPPMVIFKGVNENHKSITTIVRQRGTIIKVQPSAWMNFC